MTTTKLIIPLLLLSLTVVSCGKKGSDEPDTQVTTHEVAKHPELSSSNPAVVLKALNDVLVEYNSMYNTGDSVTNIEDLVTLKVLDRLPAAPSGRKYEIHGGMVVIR